MDCAAVGHRVLRIDDEICHDLFHVSGVHDDVDRFVTIKAETDIAAGKAMQDGQQL